MWLANPGQGWDCFLNGGFGYFPSGSVNASALWASSPRAADAGVIDAVAMVLLAICVSTRLSGTNGQGRQALLCDQLKPVIFRPGGDLSVCRRHFGLEMCVGRAGVQPALVFPANATVIAAGVPRNVPAARRFSR